MPAIRSLLRAAELIEAGCLTSQSMDTLKANFLAAVSHDLAQPIHAAHLFTHALSQRVLAQPVADSVQQIDGALASAESLLAGLLDISRLDAGGLRPAPRDFPLDEWLAHLASEFSVLAGERGLRVGAHAAQYRHLLRVDHARSAAFVAEVYGRQRG